MNRSLWYSLACCLFIPAPLLAAEGNCWVVAIAMNQDANASEDWNQYGEEFALVFKEHAKGNFRSVQVKTVLGRQARLAQIVTAFRWAKANARPKDLVAVYITAHGGTSPKEGWGAETMDGQTVWGRDFKALASSLPCPAFFVIDSCGSGGFSKPHAKDIPLPPNCVAICSSRAKQSTTNVLNIALHEALWGLADTNRDNSVDVNEIVKYIQVRARRIAPPGSNLKESEMPTLVVGSNVSGELKLTRKSGELVAVVHGGEWHLGRVKGEEGGVVKLHLMGCQDTPNKGFFVLNESPQDRVFKLEPDAWPVLVTENDRTRPALQLSSEKGQVKVKYVTGKKRSETFVERSMVRSPFPGRDAQ